MTKPAFCIYVRTKTQISWVAAEISALFSLHRWFNDYNPCTFLIQNFKPSAIFCFCTALFVSDLVEKPQDRFSRTRLKLFTYMFTSMWWHCPFSGATLVVDSPVTSLTADVVQVKSDLTKPLLIQGMSYGTLKYNGMKICNPPLANFG